MTISKKVALLSLIGLLSAPSRSWSMNLISRANCVNNESITWDPWQTTYDSISVTSRHRWSSVSYEHAEVDYRRRDNAAKAIHWLEGMQVPPTESGVNWPSGSHWIVYGNHQWSRYSGWYEFGTTYSNYCIA